MSEYLPRTMEADECKIVGNKLQTIIEKLKQKADLQLPVDLLGSSDLVIQLTLEISKLIEKRVPIIDMDRLTDRILAAFRRLLIEMQTALLDADFLEMPDEEREEVRALSDAAGRVESRCFPGGLDYLGKDPELQWADMEKVKQAILAPEVQDDLKLLGLEKVAGYLVRLIDFYSDRLGITRPKENPDFVLAEKVARWHELLEDYIADVRHHYKSTASAEQLALRKDLLSPYEEMLRLLRANDRKERERAKKRAEVRRKEKEAKAQEEKKEEPKPSTEEKKES